MITQAQIERSLTSGQALALELSRRTGGVTRFEAHVFDEHFSLGQRISDLIARGYVVSKQRETVIDKKGEKHSGIVRYFCLGWVDPTTQAAA